MQNKYLKKYLESLGYKECGLFWKKVHPEMIIDDQTIEHVEEYIEISYNENHFKIRNFYKWMVNTTTMIRYKMIDLRVIHNITELMYFVDGGDDHDINEKDHQ